MNCIFCQSSLDKDLLFNSYVCSACPIHIKFHYDPTCNILQKIEYFIWGDGIYKLQYYWISINLIDNKLKLYCNMDEITSFNYVPDINPNNAKEWLSKLLKLKSFL